MAHNINITNGQASFVSLRQSAWHGLGKVVNNEMDDDTLLREACLDWTVTEQEVFAAEKVAISADDTLTNHRKVEGWKLLQRGDTKQDLAVVGDQFRVFQNREMVSLMRQIGGETLVWETAGALGTKGATTWALARLPDLAISLGADATEMYLLLTNGHGNNRALTVMPTTVRVVCQNTMRAAEGTKAQNKSRIDNALRKDYSASALASGYGIHHNQGLDAAVRDVQAAYKSCLANRDATKVAYEMMAAKAISDADARMYWESIFAIPTAADETERVLAMREEREAKRRRALATIWRSPTSQTEAAAGTVFGAFQAAIEYIDHEAPARSPGGRAFRAVLGSDVQTKRVAWDAALMLAAAA
jgi:phage/plasmid-like protein (TIGR03299 family)